MKQTLLILVLLISCKTFAQQFAKVPPSAGEALPTWAIKMYSDHPNIWEVDDEYRKWRKDHPDDKTTYTQYYKKWRREADPYIDREGFKKRPSKEAEIDFAQRLQAIREKHSSFYKNRNGGTWKVTGPIETFNTNTGPSPLAKSSQSNIYCIDQSLSHPDILYCGTEGGEIYRSDDKGMNWNCVSRTLPIGALGAIEVHPSNPDIVFAGEDNSIWRSYDGGQQWEEVLNHDNMWTNEILIHPRADSIVMAATFNGLYRSDDGGSNWEQVFAEASYDIEWQPNNPDVAYLVINDPDARICRFYKSYDAGKTWELKDNGWYFSDLEGRADGGARLAVSDADSNRIYAVLIGEAKTDDSGFIGIYRSDDAGETWYLPNPPAGGPWNETDHPNMATIGRTGGYHQGFYNLGFDVSDSDPDQLLAGFLSLWYSTDGAYTFTCFGGYCSNDFNYVHPDCQEIEINGDDVWMTSDGGIEYSNDFFETHYARNRGITGSDYWGFGTGWNEDILVGGRYHNGNSGWFENWNEGECLSLGGGEAATGYVNPGEGRLAYFSDIGAVVLPEMQNGYAQYSSIGKFPNESYYDAESGEMEWDPLSWNTFYVTQENKLWRTTNGGKDFEILHEFGSDPNARAMGFEISRNDPEVIYLFQRDEYSWDEGILWKTIDGGEEWTQLNFPPGYARRGLLALDAEDEQRVWLAFPDAGDGEKIYTSHDGGETWQNLTTPALNGEHITYIMHQGGTDGGIYIGTFRMIWFRNDSLGEWLPYNEGLPAQISTCILRPFYRDQKIRLGAYGKGIWEAPFAAPSRPVAQPMVYKRETSCPGDTIQFDDFSMLSHAGAQWSWQFPGGTPATSDLRNPKVVYAQPGVYDVTLTVENPHGSSIKTIEAMIEVFEPVINEVPPLIDFSDTLHFTVVNPDNGITWEPISITACESEGNLAYYVNNYEYSSYGRDELVLPVNLDLSGITEPLLTFRVAYAPYYDGNAFIDSFKVLISNNCGRTFRTIFNSGGEELSTTSTGEGPGNYYEYNKWQPEFCEEWREVQLDLSEYTGLYVTIKFLSQSGYGNNIYLDDIFIEGIPVSSSKEIVPQTFSVHPNPSSGQFRIFGNTAGETDLTITLTSVTGQEIFFKSVQATGNRLEETISVVDQAAGVYFLRVMGGDGSVWVGKVVRE